MAKSSSAECNIFERKMLVNTWELRQVRLWCMDWCHESVMCVDVQCGKTLLFCQILGSRIEDVSDGVGLSPSPYDNPKENKYSMPKHKEKGRSIFQKKKKKQASGHM